MTYGISEKEIEKTLLSIRRPNSSLVGEFMRDKNKAELKSKDQESAIL